MNRDVMPAQPPVTLVRAMLTVHDGDGRGVLSSHRIGPGNAHRLTVGRSMACDVVVADPHVAAEHFEISLDDHGVLHVRDLGSINGTRLDGTSAVDHVVSDEAAHVIAAGRMRFTLRAQAEAVAAELPLDAHATTKRSSADDQGAAHEPSSWLLALGRPRRLWTMVAVVLAMAVFAHWLETSWQREAWMQVAGGMLGTLVSGGVWLGLWALVGRVVAGRARWAVQAGVMVSMVLVYVLGREAADLALFATSRVMPSIIGTLWAAACIVALLVAHLRVATHLRVRHALAWAAVLPAAVAGMALWQQYGTAGGREWAHTDGAALYLPSWRVVRPADTAVLIGDARDLQRRAVERMQASKDAELSDDDDEGWSLFD